MGTESLFDSAASENVINGSIRRKDRTRATAADVIHSARKSKGRLGGYDTEERLSERLPSHGMSTLIVKSRGKVSVIRGEEVDWVEAADYYSCLHVGARKHLIRRTMLDLEHNLRFGRFIRIHRSALVNLGRVRELLTEDGRVFVLLVDGTKLRISRRRLRSVKVLLSGSSSSPALIIESSNNHEKVC